MANNASFTETLLLLLLMVVVVVLVVVELLLPPPLPLLLWLNINYDKKRTHSKNGMCFLQI